MDLQAAHFALESRRARSTIGGVLNSAEVLFDALNAYTPVGVFVSDSTGGSVYVNQRWCELAGMSPEEAEGDGWRKALHPDDAERVQVEWAAAERSGRDSMVSYRMLRPDGGVSWIEGYASIVRDEDGHVAGWVGTCSDITLRKQAEDEAAKALTLLDAMQSSSPVGFGFVDRDFRFVRLNPSLAAINGKPVEEQIGRTIEDVLPALWPVLRPAYQAVLDTGVAVVNEELVEPTADAQSTNFLTSLYPVRIDDEVAGIAIVVLDVTEQKKAELAVRRIEQRYRELFEQTTDMIFTADLDGTFTSVNRATERLSGYTREEVKGMSMIDMVVPEARQRAVELLAQAVATRSDQLFEIEIVGKHGQKVAVEIAGHVVEETDGALSLLGVARDVTDRRGLLDRLRHQAFHDQLTGLPNRALFFDRLEQALARSERAGSPLAVLMLDLDNFKLVNDNLGHQSGDDLLVAFAPGLKDVLRRGDTVARLGGDEFAFLLEPLEGEREVIAVAAT